MVIKKGNDLVLKLDFDTKNVKMIKVYTTDVRKAIIKKTITDNKLYISSAELSTQNSGLIAYDVYEQSEDVEFDDQTYDSVYTVYTDYCYIDTDENGEIHKKTTMAIDDYIDMKINGLYTAIDGRIEEETSDKANVGDSYTKSESDAKYLTEHQDISNLATKAEVKEVANEFTNVYEKINENVEAINLINADEYQDGSIKRALKDAKAYTDEKVTDVKADVLKDAKDYTDTEITKSETSTLANAKAYTDEKISEIDADVIVSKANAYTDEKVNESEAEILTNVKAYAKSVVDIETDRAKTAETANTDAINNLKAEDVDIKAKLDKKIEKVTITKNTTSDLEYYLFVDDVKVSEINIPKDQFLKDVTYDASTKKIHFVFETSEGTKEQDIDISDLVDTYTSGDGLKLENNKFSVIVDDATEKYLTVSADGLKVIGVDEALALKANVGDSYTKTEADEKLATKADVGTSYTKAESDDKYLTEHQDISGKQDVLVSGTNIKTINNTSILGEGNIEISGGDGNVTDVQIGGTSILDDDGVANITKLVANNSSGNAMISIGEDDYNNVLVKEKKVAIGYIATASGYSSVALGYNATASGYSSVALGYIAKAEKGSGWGYSTALGSSATANGDYSTALGNSATAKGSSSTALGFNATAKGDSSVALGSSSNASGYYSVALGTYNTTASGYYSTAIGCFNTKANGYSSVALGRSTTASGDYSTAIGYQSTTTNNYESVIGSYNLSTSGETFFSVGNGTVLSDTAYPHNLLMSTQGGDLYIVEKTPTDDSTINYYEAPMKRLQTWLNEKSDKVTTTASTDAAITLKPNENIDSEPSGDLAITLEAPSDTTIVNLYTATIAIGDTVGTITLPTNVKWDKDVTFEANHFYEITIRYSSKGYFGKIVSWAL